MENINNISLSDMNKMITVQNIIRELGEEMSNGHTVNIFIEDEGLSLSAYDRDCFGDYDNFIEFYTVPIEMIIGDIETLKERIIIYQAQEREKEKKLQEKLKLEREINERNKKEEQERMLFEKLKEKYG